MLIYIVLFFIFKDYSNKKRETPKRSAKETKTNGESSSLVGRASRAKEPRICRWFIAATRRRRRAQANRILRPIRQDPQSGHQPVAVVRWHSNAECQRLLDVQQARGGPARHTNSKQLDRGQSRLEDESGHDQVL